MGLCVIGVALILLGIAEVNSACCPCDMWHDVHHEEDSGMTGAKRHLRQGVEMR